MQIAMIGLGRMGSNMVRRLLRAATNAWCLIDRESLSRNLLGKTRLQPRMLGDVVKKLRRPGRSG